MVYPLKGFDFIDDIIDIAITSYCADIIDEIVTRAGINAFLSELTPIIKRMNNTAFIKKLGIKDEKEFFNKS